MVKLYDKGSKLLITGVTGLLGEHFINENKLPLMILSLYEENKIYC